MKYIIIIFSCLLIIYLSSCSAKITKFEELNEFLKSEYNSEINPNTKWIAYLTENGCSGCNESFAELLKKHQNKNGLILIDAHGAYIDLESFIQNKSKSTIFLRPNTFSSIGIMESSGIIIIDNSAKKIDTIIQINSKNLMSQLNTIDNFIREK